MSDVPERDEWIRRREAEDEIRRLTFQVERLRDRAVAAERKVGQYEEAIASAVTSLETGPGRDGYAANVLREALDG